MPIDRNDLAVMRGADKAYRDAAAVAAKLPDDPFTSATLVIEADGSFVVVIRADGKVKEVVPPVIDLRPHP